MSIQYLRYVILFCFFYSLPLGKGGGGVSFGQEVNVTSDSVDVVLPLAPNNFISLSRMMRELMMRELRGMVTNDPITQLAVKDIDSKAGKKIADNIIAKSTTIQQLYQKLKEDSIAHSDEIQLLYNKITENAITQSNAIQQLYNKITEDSIAQFLLLSSSDSHREGLSSGQRPIGNRTKKNAIEQPALTFDAGQVFSIFKFIDSQGNKPKEFTHNRTSGFSLGYRYPLLNGLFIRINTGLRKAGASMIYEGLYVNWNIQYADANIGLGYMYPKSYSPIKGWKGGIKPYFSVSPYFGYMLKGNQLIAAFNYDIKKIKSMKATDAGLFFSPGFKIAFSKSIAFSAEYKYILGLKNLETAIDKKSTNRGWAINLGVAVTVESLKAIKWK
ncbi:MAG: hypothetical protein V4511_11985 [Bacteroidota bacterium]